MVITSVDAIAISFHACRAVLTPSGRPDVRIDASRVGLGPRPKDNMIDRHDSFAIRGTSSELLVNGPGLAQLSATFGTPMLSHSELDQPVRAGVELTPSRVTNPVVLDLDLDPTPKGPPREGDMSHRLRQPS